jgi:hypothetical protein
MRSWLIALVLLIPVDTALADEADPNLEFFYPLVIGRPVIERELELKVAHAKGHEGRETTVTGALELPVLPRWQIELEVPIVFTDPRDGGAAAGPGDLKLENKFLLFTSYDVPSLIAAGFEATLPTGSERRGLGGEAAVEAFVRGAVALGPFDLLAEIAYEWNVNAHVRGEREQTLTAGVALGYLLTRRVTPLLELTMVRRLRGTDQEDEPRLRGRSQLYVTPGINVRPLPRTTVRLGVELPVTDARTFDYAILGGVVREF